MSYKINSHFRRLGYGTGQLTGLNMYYIELSLPKAPGGSAISRPHDGVKGGTKLGPATISPCTITMDHDAIICSINDRLIRGPDADVHVPSMGSQKYPSHDVDVIYL